MFFIISLISLTICYQTKIYLTNKKRSYPTFKHFYKVGDECKLLEEFFYSKKVKEFCSVDISEVYEIFSTYKLEKFQNIIFQCDEIIVFSMITISNHQVYDVKFIFDSHIHIEDSNFKDSKKKCLGCLGENECDDKNFFKSIKWILKIVFSPWIELFDFIYRDILKSIVGEYIFMPILRLVDYIYYWLFRPGKYCLLDKEDDIAHLIDKTIDYFVFKSNSMDKEDDIIKEMDDTIPEIFIENYEEEDEIVEEVEDEIEEEVEDEVIEEVEDEVIEEVEEDEVIEEVEDEVMEDDEVIEEVEDEVMEDDEVIEEVEDDEVIEEVEEDEVIEEVEEDEVIEEVEDEVL